MHFVDLLRIGRYFGIEQCSMFNVQCSSIFYIAYGFFTKFFDVSGEIARENWANEKKNEKKKQFKENMMKNFDLKSSRIVNAFFKLL